MNYKLKQPYTITNVQFSVDGKTVSYTNMYKSKVVMSVKDFNELYEEN